MNKQKTTLKKIQEIAEEIPVDVDDFGLLSGRTGVILWYFYLSRYVDEKYYYIAEKLLMKTLSKLQNSTIIFTHCSGYSGICWMLMHLKEYEFVDMEPDILDNIDNNLFKNMAIALDKDN